MQPELLDPKYFAGASADTADWYRRVVLPAIRDEGAGPQSGRYTDFTSWGISLEEAERGFRSFAEAYRSLGPAWDEFSRLPAGWSDRARVSHYDIGRGEFRIELPDYTDEPPNSSVPHLSYEQDMRGRRGAEGNVRYANGMTLYYGARIPPGFILGSHTSEILSLRQVQDLYESSSVQNGERLVIYHEPPRLEPPRLTDQPPTYEPSRVGVYRLCTYLLPGAIPRSHECNDFMVARLIQER